MCQIIKIFFKRNTFAGNLRAILLHYELEPSLTLNFSTMTKPFILFLFLIAVTISSSFAQKILVLDKYGTKRTRITAGEEIIFRQLNNKTKYHDFISSLRDSTLILGEAKIEFPLNDFDTFYFRRPGIQYVSIGTTFIGGGFMFASAVYPLVGDPAYDQRESFIIGASFLAFSQLIKAFKYKKFKVRKNSRVRILDLTYR